MSVLAPLRAMIVVPAALLWRASVAARTHVTRRRPALRSRSILIVSWEFPPSDATGAHLPASFARHAALAGWDVSVICSPQPPTANPNGTALAACVPPSVKIRRVSRLLATEHHARMHPPAWSAPRIDGDYFTAVAMTNAGLGAFADAPPAAVFATGPRFSNFVAARRLADAFGAKLVLQYRDEWTVNTPSFVKVTADDVAAEAKCLARADLITFVSEGKRLAYEKAFPTLDRRKLMTTPNGWEPYFHDNAACGSQHLGNSEGKFRLVYTGRWHGSLEPLLQDFEHLFARQPHLQSRLQFVMVGKQLPQNAAMMTAFQDKYPGALHVMASMSPGAALEVQKEADALLLLNEHAYDGVVPLKTFDYLRGDRPILVFGREGGAAKIVEKLNAGFVVKVGDIAGLNHALTALMIPRAWDTAERNAFNAAHSRERLTGDLLNAISQI